MSGEEDTQKPGLDKSVDGPTDPKELNKLKMTGEGAPGSHSAVFGLTPDGKKHDDTSSGVTTTSKPADGEETAMGGGTVPKSEDDSSNNTSQQSSGAGVAEQMNDPRVADKGHGGSAVESTSGAGEKPGAGTGTDLGSQGTGQVGSEAQSGGSLLDKAKSYLGGSS